MQSTSLSKGARGVVVSLRLKSICILYLYKAESIQQHSAAVIQLQACQRNYSYQNHNSPLPHFPALSRRTWHLAPLKEHGLAWWGREHLLVPGKWLPYRNADICVPAVIVQNIKDSLEGVLTSLGSGFHPATCPGFASHVQV